MGECSIILRIFSQNSTKHGVLYQKKIYVNQIVITTRAYDAIAPEPLIIEQTNERTHIANY